MNFPTISRSPLGPPAVDLEEARDILVPSEDLSPNSQWDAVPGGPSSLSQMELDASSVQELVQQFEALPGDLVGPSPDGAPCPLHIATGHGLAPREIADAHGLLSAEAGRDDLLGLLHFEECPPSLPGPEEPLQPAPQLLQPPEDPEEDPDPPEWAEGATAEQGGSRSSSSSPESWLETVPLVAPEEPPAGAQSPETLASYPAPQEVPGPCDHEDLLDGVIFGARYLGSTQLVSERNPPTSTRMAQAREAMERVKAPDGETQPMTEVDLFVSTKRIKVLTADSQEAMMDHALHTISYTADIGCVLVLMARRRRARGPAPQDHGRRLHRMLCHVFHTEDAQLIAQAIGQAFAAAYSQFLQESGIDPSQVGTHPSPGTTGPGHLHNGDLDHFSNSDNCREVCLEKRRGEGLGVALVESGWGSLLPTAVIANLLHGGPAERSGALSIGDRLTAINGTSLVGLPLAACQAAVREAKSQTSVTLSIVHCPPVTTAIIHRPHAREQLGFCVEDGIICSLLRGGIAERGGIRVGHRIIEINGQSVVATPHARIIQLLTEAYGEVHIKTMPAATYRLLTGQEQPVYL
ncbi:amyloid-beta A4 precursor protein-binding family A member 3 isoform X1 [Callithrix jacchus]|uniref:Amyloid-beta A4 precursor protein-binding family A member 3 n=1 Tax=Callithrix jacchus TaxID=9483 RepID=U3C8T4_CALJA|nr:amyloid-beta A4 precursor protein-binding family A member 3 isoform X1 [Callithrix jacchus]XP_035139739.2 amyloid-beta A4 precursor protein-binding family A member 3 isoform X1 [Callithrix jacchus]